LTYGYTSAGAVSYASPAVTMRRAEPSGRALKIRVDLVVADARDERPHRAR